MMQLTNTKNQTGRAMGELIRVINDTLRERGHVASGSLIRSNTVVVNDTGKQVFGLGYANDYWTRAGSGTPKGTEVSFVALAQWAQQKGLGRNPRETLRIASLVQRKIRREGSLDWRLGNPNVYIEAIDNFVEDGRFLPEDGAEKDLTAFRDDTFKNIN